MKIKNKNITAFIIMAFAFNISILFLIENMNSAQMKIWTSGFGVYSLNNQFKECINKLYYIELDVNRQIQHNKPIIPKTGNLDFFAGKELLYIINWYDALLNSAEYKKHNDSLKSIIGSMEPAIASLDRSFEKIIRINPNERQKRYDIFENELTKNVYQLIVLCDQFVSESSQNYSIKRKNESPSENVMLFLKILLVTGNAVTMLALVVFVNKTTQI